MRIPAYPDGDSGNIRTLNRHYPDTLSVDLINDIYYLIHHNKNARDSLAQIHSLQDVPGNILRAICEIIDSEEFIKVTIWEFLKKCYETEFEYDFIRDFFISNKLVYYGTIYANFGIEYGFINKKVEVIHYYNYEYMYFDEFVESIFLKLPPQINPLLYS